MSGGTFYRKIRTSAFGKKPAKWLSGMWANKKLSTVIAIGFILLLYALFNNNGILQRIRLEHSKQELKEKIEHAQQEQKQLLEQSKALDGDKEAIEKVAREKYGMIRKGEKVYRVAPKK
ncbi:MAG: septum formation initiator family protein [Bacteroidota bacterium]|nr:septum formation initiator family protein [Bacteroidota bacterium]